LQPPDCQQEFDLSPFPVFGGAECHTDKNMPSEEACLRSFLTKQTLNQAKFENRHQFSSSLSYLNTAKAFLC
jgi:hypothetical protein